MANIVPLHHRLHDSSATKPFYNMAHNIRSHMHFKRNHSTRPSEGGSVAPGFVRGTPSKSRPGRLDFETHKGDKDFHEDHHNIEINNVRPFLAGYTKMRKAELRHALSKAGVRYHDGHTLQELKSIASHAMRGDTKGVR